MRMVRVFLSRAWPLCLAGYLFVFLWGAARATQHGPHFRTGLTLDLDHDHDIRWGAFHVVSECTLHVCEVRAWLREGELSSQATRVSALRGGVLHFEIASGVLVTTPARPLLIQPAPRPSLWIPGWATWIGIAILAVQSVNIFSRRDRLVEGARPCLIQDGQVEFVDGKTPRHATPTHTALDGVGWACVRAEYGRESYREGSGERCDVLADRDGAIANTHRDMHFVVVGGVMLLVPWLPWLFLVTE